MREFQTQCLVEAPIELCFSVLTDFARYPVWSPVHRYVHRTGNELYLGLVRGNSNSRTTTVRAKVRIESAPFSLAWGGGIPGCPWLLDVHHYFELTRDGFHTRLLHGETFSGLFGILFAWLGGAKLLPRYRAFNEAFRTRCLDLAQMS